jgi:hypothetical protein
MIYSNQQANLPPASPSGFTLPFRHVAGGQLLRMNIKLAGIAAGMVGGDMMIFGFTRYGCSGSSGNSEDRRQGLTGAGALGAISGGLV